MNINNAYPSKYLKSGELPEEGDVVLTIKNVKMETVGQGDDAEEKPVVYFREQDKGLVLNKTNADTISKLHGPETDGWTGKHIALFSTEVDYAGKQTLAIRVRIKAPKTSGKAPTDGAKASGELWDRWVKLWERGLELGVTKDLEPAAADISSEALIEKGKALRALVDAAEKDSF